MPLSAGRNRPSARRLGIRGGCTVTFEAHFAALLSAEEFEDTECAERTAVDGSTSCNPSPDLQVAAPSAESPFMDEQ
jgi:hypothetical protein